MPSRHDGVQPEQGMEGDVHADPEREGDPLRRVVEMEEGLEGPLEPRLHLAATGGAPEVVVGPRPQRRAPDRRCARVRPAAGDEPADGGDGHAEALRRLAQARRARPRGTASRSW